MAKNEENGEKNAEKYGRGTAKPILYFQSAIVKQVNTPKQEKPTLKNPS